MSGDVITVEKGSATPWTTTYCATRVESRAADPDACPPTQLPSAISVAKGTHNFNDAVSHSQICARGCVCRVNRDTTATAATQTVDCHR